MSEKEIYNSINHTWFKQMLEQKKEKECPRNLADVTKILMLNKKKDDDGN